MSDLWFDEVNKRLMTVGRETDNDNGVSFLLHDLNQRLDGNTGQYGILAYHLSSRKKPFEEYEILCIEHWAWYTSDPSTHIACGFLNH